MSIITFHIQSFFASNEDNLSYIKQKDWLNNITCFSKDGIKELNCLLTISNMNQPLFSYYFCYQLYNVFFYTLNSLMNKKGNITINELNDYIQVNRNYLDVIKYIEMQIPQIDSILLNNITNIKSTISKLNTNLVNMKISKVIPYNSIKNIINNVLSDPLNIKNILLNNIITLWSTMVVQILKNFFDDCESLRLSINNIITPIQSIIKDKNVQSLMLIEPFDNIFADSVINDIIQKNKIIIENINNYIKNFSIISSKLYNLSKGRSANTIPSILNDINTIHIKYNNLLKRINIIIVLSNIQNSNN